MIARPQVLSRIRRWTRSKARFFSWMGVAASVEAVDYSGSHEASLKNRLRGRASAPQSVPSLRLDVIPARPDVLPIFYLKLSWAGLKNKVKYDAAPSWYTNALLASPP
jgi:hypothetical protein